MEKKQILSTLIVGGVAVGGISLIAMIANRVSDNKLLDIDNKQEKYLQMIMFGSLVIATLSINLYNKK